MAGTMADYKERLIEAVREFPVLYDHTRRDYKDIIKKGNSWEAVAEKVGVTDK